MRYGDYIVTHDDYHCQEKAGGDVVVYPMTAVVGGYLLSNGLALPESPAPQGEVRARIEEGRWIIDCPGGCGGALFASKSDRRYICVSCGSPENGGRWYHVVFPVNHRRIELALLKRPNKRGPAFPNHATERNWRPGETLEDLNRENLEHWIV